MKDKALDPAYFSTRAAEGKARTGTALDATMLFWLQTRAGYAAVCFKGTALC